MKSRSHSSCRNSPHPNAPSLILLVCTPKSPLVLQCSESRMTTSPAVLCAQGLLSLHQHFQHTAPKDAVEAPIRPTSDHVIAEMQDPTFTNTSATTTAYDEYRRKPIAKGRSRTERQPARDDGRGAYEALSCEPHPSRPPRWAVVVFLSLQTLLFPFVDLGQQGGEDLLRQQRLLRDRGLQGSEA